MAKFKEKAFQPIDKEEEELMDAIENDEWHSVPDLETQKKRAVEAAVNTLRKDRRINLRLSQKDYHQIQIRATYRV